MHNRGGFTVVETLIALAISSSLFVTMMIAFSGRQGRVEFSQGLRDIESYIQDVANDVRNGYYPSVSNKTCGFNNITSSIEFTESPSNQGTSAVCVFTGKIMVFDSSVPKSSLISSYSLTGLRSATNLSELKLAPIGSSGNETREDYKMPGGISLIKSDFTNTSAVVALIFDIQNVGVESLNTKKISNVKPYLYPFSSNDGNGIKTTLTNTPTAIDATDKTLCFLGANGQKGIISIKKGPDGLTTSVQIGQTSSNCVSSAGV